jgi:tripartite-type tricarboxylate transporter receptor subunit TctC
MHTVETTFKMSYTDEQYIQAKAYVEDMKKHKDRVFWIGKEGKNDDELILGHIAHKILSGFYNAYDGYGSAAILEMINAKANGNN